MPTPDSTLAHYRDQQRLTATAVLAARRQWALLGEGDFDAAWRSVGPRILAIVAVAQSRAAADGAAYIAQAVGELGLATAAAGAVEPDAFVGIASDGRPLETLLYQPVIAARVAMRQGQRLPEALSAARSGLDRLIRTQVADAARDAASVALVTRPGVAGWVRMLNLPSCSRCAVLGGKFFRWNQGFSRHPGCDCRHIPANESLAGDLTTDPRKAIESGQIRGLSRADTRAIVDDGADVGQVINAHRGMSTTTAYGRRLKTTTEGTTKRGVAGKRLGGQYAKTPGARYTSSNVPRLRPEEIYRQAGDDRAEAIRLLDRFGYLNT